MCTLPGWPDRPQASEGKVAKHAIRIDVVGELVEVHVGDGQIVLDALDRRRDRPEGPSRLGMQVNYEQCVVPSGHGGSIGQEDEAVLVVLGDHSPKVCWVKPVKPGSSTTSR
jgi:hypothetical protein